MKKIFLYLGLLMTCYSYSQPVPDYLLYSDTLRLQGKAVFTDYGDKFFFEHDGGSQQDPIQIVLKNYDGSIFKTFTPVNGLSYMPFMMLRSHVYGNDYEGEYGYGSISDKLFDNDSEIEYLAVKNVSSDNYLNSNILYIVNEFGNIEYTFPDTVINYTISIFKFSGSYKMSYEISANGSYSGKYRTFTLPGFVPCDQCGILNGMANPDNGIGETRMKAYPNPFNQTLSIEYNFSQPQEGKLVLTGVDGKELKSIELRNQSDKLTLSTSDLPKGMVIANLYGKNENLIGKKLVKIE